MGSAALPANGQLKPVPLDPGVYRFRDARGRVLYLGRAVNLRRRVASYWRDLKDRQHLAPMVAAIRRVEVLACDSEHEAAWLERNILERSMPRWNRTPGGQESPIFLELSDSQASPGLRVTFRPTQGVPVFGPYLGGNKARLATSGLLRLYPLAYTGTRLTAAEREMADKLAVSRDQREELVSALAAVLRRDDDAVAGALAGLRRLRDSASGELAFERAQRLQDEIVGLEWVCAQQKATVAEPVDLVFFGWSADTLVRFEIVAGRLSGWQARACPWQRAEPKVAATPAHWAAFAARNAAIAAALRASDEA